MPRAGSVAVHHVAGTWDPADNRVRLYVDGKLDGDEPGPAPPNSNDRPLNIGFIATPDGIGARFFNGIVDEVMIFPRALSQAEIWAIVAAGETSVKSVGG